MAKVTIEDISRQTGLSRGTVSRALNNRPDISEKTKERVLEACRTLNYVPSHAARSLATGRNYAVAVIVDDLHCAFAARYLRGVLVVAEQHHYIVHVTETGPDANRAAERLRGLAAERIDGVVLVCPLAGELLAAFGQSWGDRPLVAASVHPGLSADVFGSDAVESGRIAARFALDRGWRSLIYLDPAADGGAGHRRSGFREACAERGLSDDHLILALDGSAADETRICERLPHVQAIVSGDDETAALAMRLCERVGRPAGRQIAVISQGNTIAAALRPSLTSVDPGAEEAGRRAMATLLQRLAGERMDAPRIAAVVPQLIERASTRLEA